MPGLQRTDEIVAFVINHKNYVWDAYDQGRWAHSIGSPRSNNPHRTPAFWHINEADWERGWDAEEARKQALLVGAPCAA